MLPTLPYLGVHSTLRHPTRVVDASPPAARNDLGGRCFQTTPNRGRRVTAWGGGAELDTASAAAWAPPTTRHGTRRTGRRPACPSHVGAAAPTSAISTDCGGVTRRKETPSRGRQQRSMFSFVKRSKMTSKCPETEVVHGSDSDRGDSAGSNSTSRRRTSGRALDKKVSCVFRTYVFRCRARLNCFCTRSTDSLAEAT